MCAHHELTSPPPKEQALDQRFHPDGPLCSLRCLGLDSGESGWMGLGTSNSSPGDETLVGD